MEHRERGRKAGLTETVKNDLQRPIEVALLTGGIDKPYVLGLTPTLVSEGISVEVVGSDQVDSPLLHDPPAIRFLNLRGNQAPGASVFTKVTRILKYYARLIQYAATAKPRLFHILWNNKFQIVDRILLMQYYRLLGKKIILTAHNVNAARRDSNDSFLNRFSLGMQYRLAHHIFVHTEEMRRQLIDDFHVPAGKATVIPFGINTTLPNTSLTAAQAKQALGVRSNHKTLLFFGRITPYKGLEYLIAAMGELARRDENYRLIVAGTIKDCQQYWSGIQQAIAREGIRDKIIERIEFIPDEQVELFFKAADVVLLPYTDIFQSGVLALGYGFGLPVIASDVGSLREDILEGKTGFVCHPRDPLDLARGVNAYFSSDLFRSLPERRQSIRDYANERFSWAKVGGMTKKVYLQLLAGK